MAVKNTNSYVLATKHQVGVINVSIGSIDNCLSMQNALQTQRSFENMPILVKIGNVIIILYIWSLCTNKLILLSN